MIIGFNFSSRRMISLVSNIDATNYLLVVVVVGGGDFDVNVNSYAQVLSACVRNKQTLNSGSSRNAARMNSFRFVAFCSMRAVVPWRN